MMKDTYPLLVKFFDGAFATNSGGRFKEEDFAGFKPQDMERAEKELEAYLSHFHNTSKRKGMELLAYFLGGAADSGYTVHGQTMQDLPAGSGNDDQHKLIAFDLLESCY